MILTAWALISPIIMPVFKFAIPWLVPFWGVTRGTFSIVRPFILPAVIGLLGWWAFATIWSKPDKPDSVLVSDVKANRLQAENKALRSAFKEREQALLKRVQQLNEERDGLVSLLHDQEKARDLSNEEAPQLGQPTLPADNSWVRSKQRKAGTR